MTTARVDAVIESVKENLEGYEPATADALHETIEGYYRIAVTLRRAVASLAGFAREHPVIQGRLADDLDEVTGGFAATYELAHEAFNNFYDDNKFWLDGGDS